jgi:hypothetical protein
MMPFLAQAKKDQGADLFVIQGRVFEIDIASGEDKPASEVQVVIYQDKDIYVAFYTQKNGDYEFQLPLGHEYEIWFGGSTFVNKKVYVDARNVKPAKGQHEIALDMGLFRPMDNYTFDLLDKPFVRFAWDTEYGQFLPDLEYTEGLSKELEKIFRKVRKSGGK